jgi:uncharacterized protein YjbJ (UPF0337 family)
MRTNTQTSTQTSVLTRLQGYLKGMFAALLMLVLAWQSPVLTGNTAIASPIASPLVAVSVDSMSKQVNGKADEVKGKAKQSIGKIQSGMEEKGGAVRSKVKDDVTNTKIAVDSNNARVNNAADKTADKVKGFFK